MDKNNLNISLLNLLLLFFLPAANSLSGQSNQNNPYTSDNVFSDKIKTVQLYREEWNLSYPMMKLNSKDGLVLHFDLLEDQPESFYYTIIHCDKDWNRSDIFINDYLGGFEENPLEDYRSSFNTTVHYYHYSLRIPNDRISLKLSGNYVVSVYLPGQKDKPLLTRRFIVSEETAAIKVTARRPQMTGNSNTHQQVDFTVSLSGLALNDPYRNLYAFVLQNGRWDMAKQNLKPDIFGSNELKYSSLSDKITFPGGNEFRYFDIKSIRYQSEFIRSIDFATPYYNVYLQPSDNREFKPYFYWKDFNGKYFIAFQEGREADIDADYVYVYFTLPAYQKAEGGEIYVSGALTGWKAGKDNHMTWNDVKKQYECTMLLKQGWYNYEYVFVKNGKAEGTAGPFEGSHFETENDYIILLYYRNPLERYDRVIGSVTANTLNRITD